MIALDSTLLLLLLDDQVPIPRDPATKKPYEKGRQRIEHFIDNLSTLRVQVLIPTPVLSEVLVKAGVALPQYLARIRSDYNFRIGDFDQKSAVELAMMNASALSTGKKRGSAASATAWQKIKLDRQIIAITKSQGANAIYSTDGDLRKTAKGEGLQAFDLSDIPLPPTSPQAELPFEA